MMVMCIIYIVHDISANTDIMLSKCLYDIYTMDLELLVQQDRLG